MQLATFSENKMWSCNLHFYADDDMNLYWMSSESRKHSQHIAQDGRASVAIMVHEDKPDEKYVVGIQMSGRAEKVPDLVQPIKDAFFAKVGTPPAIQADIASGKIQNAFYKFTPDEVVLFSNKDFPEEPRQTVKL